MGRGTMGHDLPKARRSTADRVKLGVAMVLLAALGWVSLRGCGPVEAPFGIGAGPQPEETRAVEIDGRSFELELALTPTQRYRGLSDRESIPDDGGMLFVFPDAEERTFVMRRCLVPIDIIYLDASGRVVQMHEMAVESYYTPELALTGYPSGAPAQFAIELAGGTLDELDISQGDRVEVPLGLKARAR